MKSRKMLGFTPVYTPTYEAILATISFQRFRRHATRQLLAQAPGKVQAASRAGRRLHPPAHGNDARMVWRALQYSGTQTAIPSLHKTNDTSISFMTGGQNPVDGNEVVPTADLVQHAALERSALAPYRLLLELFWTGSLRTTKDSWKSAVDLNCFKSKTGIPQSSTQYANGTGCLPGFYLEQ